MSTGLGDFALAANFRDIITGMIQTEIDKKISFRFAEVTSISADHKTIEVEFPESPGVQVEVRVADTIPRAVGQVVQIMVQNGKYTLFAVMGAGEVRDYTGPELAQVTGLDTVTVDQSITATWLAVPGALKYEIQMATNAGFTVGLQVFNSTVPTYTATGLVAGTTYYFRVRALNAYGATPGAWSITDSIQCSATTVTSGNVVGDGAAPTSSPIALVTPGIGYLVVNWAATVNLDPVIYDVHISTVSNFTPSPSTKIGETRSTFFVVRTLANGITPLTYGTLYYIRLIARDLDGSGPAGIQGSGTPSKVNTGDAGTIASDHVGTDGVAPPGLAAAPIIDNGIGFLLARWTLVSNYDPVSYEVHVSSTSGFTPSSNTLVTTTPSAFMFIKNVGPGAGGGPLVYGTTYYVKIVPRDADGAGPASGQGTGVVLQVLTPDVADGIVTANKILNGSIQLSKLSENLAGSVSQAFYDDMSDMTPWIGGASGTFISAPISDGLTGGDAMRITGPKGPMRRSDTFIPFDPDVLYRVKVRFRRTVDPVSTSTLYLGLRGYAADRVSLVNTSGINSDSSHHYVVCSSRTLTVAEGWVTLTGYVKGTGPTGSGTGHADPANPGVMHEDVRYISPSIHANWNLDAAAQTEIDLFTIEVVESGLVYDLNLAQGAVTNLKIADDAVRAPQIQDAAILAAKLASDSVTTTKILNGAITNAKVATNAIDTGNIVAGAVDSLKLADDAVTNAKIATNAINTAEILDGAIATAKIANLAVATGKIALLAVGSAQVADAAIVNAKIGDAAITTAKIGDAQIVSAKIADLAVSTAKIADAAIVTLKVADGAIVNAKIGDAAITTAKIGDAQITDAKITALDAVKITTGTLAAARIAAGSVTTDKLTVGAFGTNEAPNGSLTEWNGGTPVGWGYSLGTGVTVAKDTTSPIAGDASVVLTFPGTSQGASFLSAGAQYIPVRGGESFHLGALISSSVAKASGLYVRAYFFLLDKVTPASVAFADAQSNVAFTTATAWYEGSVDVPSNARFMRVQIILNGPVMTTAGQTVEIGTVEARKVVVSAQIADGAVIAAKIQAGAITAGKIGAGVVTTLELAAGSVTTDKLTVATIGANAALNGSLEEWPNPASNPTGWVRSMGAGVTMTPVTGTSSVAGSQSMNVFVVTSGLTANFYQDPDYYIPVVPGERWQLGAFIGADNANAVLNLRADWWDGAKVSVAGAVSAKNGTLGQTATQWYDGTVLVPSGARFMRVTLLMGTSPSGTTLTIGDIQARPVVLSTQIADGAIIAPKIAAGAITAEKLTIGAITDNMLLNGTFEEWSGLYPAGWLVSPSAGCTFNQTAANSALSGLASVAVIVVTPGATASCAIYTDESHQVPVNAGDVWYLGATIWSSVAQASGLYLRAYFFTEDHVTQTATPTVDAKANQPLVVGVQSMEGQITVPTGAKFMQVRVSFSAMPSAGQLKVDDVKARRVVVSAQIADGAITTPKIIAGAITAASGIIADAAIGTAKIIDASITTAKIADLSVSTAKIQLLAVTNALIANATITDAKIIGLTATKITAGTIGADLLVSARIKTADTGARAEMSSLGFLGYDSSGVLNFQASNSGTSYMRGKLVTDVSGKRLEWNASLGQPEIRFYPTSSTWYGYIQSGDAGGQASITMASGRAQSNDANGLQGLVYVAADRALIYYGDQGDEGILAGVDMTTAAEVYIYTNNTARLKIDANGSYLYAGRYDGPGGGELMSYQRQNGVRFGWTNPGGVFQAVVDNTIVHEWGPGHKSFVIDHPMKPDNLLVHSTTESPKAGVEYWGRVDIKSDVVVTLPGYFEALTSQDDRSVILTPHSPDMNPWCSEIMDGMFIVHSDKPGSLSWLVKAVRKDIDQFEVEPRRDSVNVHGDGPYRYLTEKV